MKATRRAGGVSPVMDLANRDRQGAGVESTRTSSWWNRLTRGRRTAHPLPDGRGSPGTSRRRGFTLLEVLLASLIAILLLGALYFAMDITMRQTSASRDAVDVENLSRGVFHRLSLDLSCSLGPLPPKSGGNSASGTNTSGMTSSDPSMMSSGTAPDAGGMTPTTGATGTTPTTAADPAAAPAPTSGTGETGETTDPEAPIQPQAADIAFQGGVIGYETQLTIFVSQLPPALATTGGLLAASESGMPGPSDLWRITYWRGQNGELCRQVRPWVTADGVRNSADPDLTTEVSDTLLPEVTDVLFEYWEATPDGGGSWIASWDGTAPAPDGITPIGPPRAIRVTLYFELPPLRSGDLPLSKSVQQVIPVRTAPGSYTPAMLEPSTDPGTVTPEDPAAMADPATGTDATGEGAAPTPTPAPTTPSMPAAPSGGGMAPAGGAGGGRGGMGGGR